MTPPPDRRLTAGTTAATTAVTTAAICLVSAPGAAAPTPPRDQQVITDAFHTAAIDAGDLDGDGRPDLAAAGYVEDSVSWFQQSDDEWIRHDVHALCGATSVIVRDIDADGDLDLVATSRVEDSVWWYENRAEHAEGAPPVFLPHFVFVSDGGDPSSVDAADVDGDGTRDLIVAFTHRPEIHVLPNLGGSGDGLGSILVTIPVPGNGVSWVRGEDMDGDGDIDILAATPWDWVDHVNYYWFRNDGADGFSAQIPIAGGEHLHGAFAADVADLDGDGRRDLVTMSDWGQGNRTVNWFRRLDDAGTEWSDAIEVDGNFFGSEGTQSLQAADLDGDGRVDLVAGSSFIGPGLRVWWNRGLAADGSVRFHAEAVAPGFPAHGVTAVDLDGDGGLELVAGSWEFDGGTIGAWRMVDPPCPADLDGDGQVGAIDMTMLLAAWGPANGIGDPADLDGDGTVGPADLVALLGAWGPC